MLHVENVAISAPAPAFGASTIDQSSLCGSGRMSQIFLTPVWNQAWIEAVAGEPGPSRRAGRVLSRGGIIGRLTSKRPSPRTKSAQLAPVFGFEDFVSDFGLRISDFLRPSGIRPSDFAATRASITHHPIARLSNAQGDRDLFLRRLHMLQRFPAQARARLLQQRLSSAELLV